MRAAPLEASSHYQSLLSQLSTIVDLVDCNLAQGLRKGMRLPHPHGFRAFAWHIRQPAQHNGRAPVQGKVALVVSCGPEEPRMVRKWWVPGHSADIWQHLLSWDFVASWVSPRTGHSTSPATSQQNLLGVARAKRTPRSNNNKKHGSWMILARHQRHQEKRCTLVKSNDLERTFSFGSLQSRPSSRATPRNPSGSSKSSTPARRLQWLSINS